MPGDTFSHTAAVNADIPDIWSALQTADTWAHIGPVTKVWDERHDDDGNLAGYRWSADAAGRQWEGTARTEELLVGERMSLTLKSPELRGTLTTDLETTEDGITQLTVTLEARAVGMLATLFWGVVKQAIGSGLPHQVDEFAARFSG
ncbi:SRPBCC family protein [bacterium]|nr:SRPBCC family protein [bacterium]